jgi:fatty acid desaturase
MMNATPPWKAARRTSGLFAFDRLDLLPVLAACAHLCFVAWIVAGFSGRSWWADLLCGGAYAWLIAWNVNGISHNFIHTPYFRARVLNRAFALLECLAIGFSQTYYKAVHLAHHVGNADRPDSAGNTRDPLSIYRHGRDGAPEPVLRYMFLGALRNDAPALTEDLRRRRPGDARWIRVELGVLACAVAAALLVNWKAVLFLLPFNYLGQALSQLSGYYEHYRGNPDEPIAWGVSSSSKLYNLLWFGNGFHAEHHFRPSVHWSKLKVFQRSISEQQAQRGTHVIETSHMIGFLAPANRKEAS